MTDQDLKEANDLFTDITFLKDELSRIGLYKKMLADAGYKSSSKMEHISVIGNFLPVDFFDKYSANVRVKLTDKMKRLSEL